MKPPFNAIWIHTCHYTPPEGLVMTFCVVTNVGPHFSEIECRVGGMIHERKVKNEQLASSYERAMKKIEPKLKQAFAMRCPQGQEIEKSFKRRKHEFDWIEAENGIEQKKGETP